MKKRRKEMSPEELKDFLSNRVVLLGCGHRFCLHPLSNTLVITAEGSLYCLNCYY
jgi:hypothetical protein